MSSPQPVGSLAHESNTGNATTVADTTRQPPRQISAAARAQLFKDKNFLYLISGAFLSALGDQFTLIALPWLVLQTTQDSFKLGLCLALLGIPRALLMLFGGALIDRYSPKTVMQLCKYFNAGLLSLFAVLLFLGYTNFPFIAGFALLLGVSTAFSIPAGPAMMPAVVSPERLAAANACMMFIRNLSMIAGPLLISLLLFINELSHSTSQSDLTGLCLAFLFDGMSYAMSIWTLEQVRFLADPASPQSAPQSTASVLSRLWQELLAGLHFCWQLQQLRDLFLYIAAIAVFTMGPLQVVLPLLAQRSAQGASVLGLLAASHGAGTLLGLLATSIVPRLRFGSLGKTLLLIDAVVACCFLTMSVIQLAWLLAILLFAVGLLSGYLQVAVYTWIQAQVPTAFLGRAMSIFMLIFMGVVPLSAGVSGAILHSLSLPQMIVWAGTGLLVVVLLAAWKSSLRNITDHS